MPQTEHPESARLQYSNNLLGAPSAHLVLHRDGFKNSDVNEHDYLGAASRPMHPIVLALQGPAAGSIGLWIQ